MLFSYGSVFSFFVTCSHWCRSLSDRFPALRKSDRHGFTVVFTAWRHADNSGACLDSGRDLASVMLILYLHTYTVTFPPQHSPLLQLPD